MDYEIDDDKIIAYIQKHYCPEDVFTVSDLDYWALSNGFVKEE